MSVRESISPWCRCRLSTRPSFPGSRAACHGKRSPFRRFFNRKWQRGRSTGRRIIGVAKSGWADQQWRRLSDRKLLQDCSTSTWVALDTVGGTAVEQLFVHISAELHASRYPCPEGYFFQAHSAGRVDRQLAKAMRSFLDFFRSKVLNLIHKRHHFKNPEKRLPVSKVSFEAHNAMKLS